MNYYLIKFINIKIAFRVIYGNGKLELVETVRSDCSFNSLNLLYNIIPVFESDIDQLKSALNPVVEFQKIM